MLDRHKKLGVEGFKNFVRNIETTPKSKRDNVVDLSFVEDPIYVSYALKNILTIERVLELSLDDLKLFVGESEDNLLVFIKAFARTKVFPEVEENILSKIASKSQVADLVGFAKKTNTPPGELQAILIKLLRNMIDQDKLKNFPWVFPDASSLNLGRLNGKTGPYSKRYETGKVALVGSLVRGKRNGIWDIFHENGKLFAEGQYDNGIKTGFWTFFHPDGGRKAYGNFSRDTKQGKWKLWDLNGVLIEPEKKSA